MEYSYIHEVQEFKQHVLFLDKNLHFQKGREEKKKFIQKDIPMIGLENG
jgi:hypothetical protein